MPICRKISLASAFVLIVISVGFGQKAHVFVTIPSGLPVPEYGDSVKEYGLIGSVEVFFRIDAAGKVAVASLKGPLLPCSNLKSPLPARIRNAVLDAVNKAELVPVLENGKPARTGSILEFRFDPSAGSAGEDPNRPIPTIKTFGTINDMAKELPDPVFSKSGSNTKEVVALDVLVSETGSVVAVLPYIGRPHVHTAAMEAACKAKFSPVVVSQRKVRFFGQIVYRFGR